MITGATLQNYTATTAGSYKVVVTNTNNCSRTSVGKIITVNCLMRAENEEPVVMSILPNPTVGMIRLTFNSKENQNAELMIIDITGRAIIQQHIKRKKCTLCQSQQLCERNLFGKTNNTDPRNDDKDCKRVIVRMGDFSFLPISCLQL